MKEVLTDNIYNISVLEKKNKQFNKLLFYSGVFVIIILIVMLFSLLSGSWLAIQTNGLNFFINSTWDPINEKYGSLPFIIGTLMTSFIALAFSLPFSLAIALFLGEYFEKGLVISILKSTIELLAGIPSVVYGFVGIIIVVPFVRTLQLKFGVLPYGFGIMSASLVLSIMIIPFSASIATEVIKLVPKDLKEVAYSLGATKFEVIKYVVLPYAKSGIFAGVLLSLGRALGETLAVTMVIGNSSNIPSSIFSPGNSMASIIATDFNEATNPLYLSSLLEIALLLFFITAFINFIGRFFIKRSIL